MNKDTIAIVVGTGLMADLLDRPVAEFLRDEIDPRGAANPFRRALVMSDQAWFDEAETLINNPVIAIGGPKTNRLISEFGEWVSRDGKGKYSIPGTPPSTGFFRKNERASRPWVRRRRLRCRCIALHPE